MALNKVATAARNATEHIIQSYSSPHPKQHLIRFSRYCRAYGCDQFTHTQKQTTLHTDICSNRPFLCTDCMQCMLKIKNIYATALVSRRRYQQQITRDFHHNELDGCNKFAATNLTSHQPNT